MKESLPALEAIYDSLVYQKKVQSQVDFANKVGYSEGYISRLMKSGEELPIKLRHKIQEAFTISEPEFEYMTKGMSAKESTPKEVIPLGKQAHSRLQPGQYKDAFSSWGGLPMYNMPITASFIASYRDEQGIIPQYYFYDPRFRDCDFGAIITGDSMHSEIRHGDFIALKEITDMNFVVFGDIYYIVAKNGLETCKYLNADPRDPEAFLLVPKNEKISPSPIKKDMVLKMYKVRGIIRGY